MAYTNQIEALQAITAKRASFKTATEGNGGRESTFKDVNRVRFNTSSEVTYFLYPKVEGEERHVCSVCEDLVAEEAIAVSCHDGFDCAECLNQWFKHQHSHERPAVCPRCDNVVSVPNLEPASDDEYYNGYPAPYEYISRYNSSNNQFYNEFGERLSPAECARLMRSFGGLQSGSEDDSFTMEEYDDDDEGDDEDDENEEQDDEDPVQIPDSLAGSPAGEQDEDDVMTDIEPITSDSENEYEGDDELEDEVDPEEDKENVAPAVPTITQSTHTTTNDGVRSTSIYFGRPNLRPQRFSPYWG